MKDILDGLLVEGDLLPLTATASVEKDSRVRHSSAASSQLDAEPDLLDALASEDVGEPLSPLSLLGVVGPVGLTALKTNLRSKLQGRFKRVQFEQEGVRSSHLTCLRRQLTQPVKTLECHFRCRTGAEGLEPASGSGFTIAMRS